MLGDAVSLYQMGSTNLQAVARSSDVEGVSFYTGLGGRGQRLRDKVGK